MQYPCRVTSADECDPILHLLSTQLRSDCNPRERRRLPSLIPSRAARSKARQPIIAYWKVPHNTHMHRLFVTDRMLVKGVRCELCSLRAPYASLSWRHLDRTPTRRRTRHQLRELLYSPQQPWPQTCNTLLCPNTQEALADDLIVAHGVGKWAVVTHFRADCKLK